MSIQYLTRQEDVPVPCYVGRAWPRACMEPWHGFWPRSLWNWMLASTSDWCARISQTVAVILTFRDRVNGLLLSELGGYLDTPDKAPAGTKRLSHLLHCAKWSAELIRQYLWQRATERVTAWKNAGLDALAIWDESVWEKPESIVPEEFGPVRSSKAARLTRIKKGYYTPPR